MMPAIPSARSALAYARAEARTMIVDRGMLAVDMVLATTVPILLQVAVWSAIFASGSDVGIGLAPLISYYVFVVGLSRINNGYDVVEQFSEAVHQGTLDPHLVRPLPYWLQRLAGFIGGSTVYLIVMAVALGIDVVVRPLSRDVSVVDILTFLLTVLTVLLVSQVLTFFVAFTLALLVAWSTRPDLALSLLILLQTVLGGTVLPPDLWGSSLRWFMTHNPFAYMLATPAQLLSSRDVGLAIPSLLGALAYITVFALASWVLWLVMMRRFEGVGG